MAGKPLGLSEDAEKALRDLEKCEQFHDKLVRDVAERWEAYEGHMGTDSDAAQWQSQLHPPLLNHISETTVAALLDDRFQYRIRPAPRYYDPGEYESARKGAKAHEILFRRQLHQDRFNEFQRPFVLQAAVARLSVAKTIWKNETVKSKRMVVKDIGPEVGSFFPVLRLVEEDYVRRDFDGPCTECVDVRDFYWDEAATSLENAAWAADAVWMTIDDLRKLQRRGVYDRVDELDAPGDASDDTTERRRESRGRKKGRIEVLHIYHRASGKCYVLGGRKVVLREKPWPFWHGEYPYVVTSLQPYPFSLQGMSVVEKLMHLQEAVWDMLNQQADSVRLLANPIYAVRRDLDDLDSLVWEPGALWPVEDPGQVQQLAVDPTPATMAMPTISQYISMMQNLAQSQPFTSTAEARGIGADTATEAALVTNIAQRATVAVKSQLNYAYERIGCQRMKLNQQFIRAPVYAYDVGLDNQEEITEILPHLLQGEYDFEVTPSTESAVRAEKRAEAAAKMTAILQAIPLLAPMGVLMNGKRVMEDFLRAYDEEDTEGWFTEQPQPGMVGAGGPAQPGGAPAPSVNGGGPGGVTAPQSIDPAVSPSAQTSQSGQTMMQRAFASQGAPRGG